MGTIRVTFCFQKAQQETFVLSNKSQLRTTINFMLELHNLKRDERLKVRSYTVDYDLPTCRGIKGVIYGNQKN